MKMKKTIIMVMVMIMSVKKKELAKQGM